MFPRVDAELMAADELVCSRAKVGTRQFALLEVVVGAAGNATAAGGIWVNIVLPLLVLFLCCH